MIENKLSYSELAAIIKSFLRMEAPDTVLKTLSKVLHVPASSFEDLLCQTDLLVTYKGFKLDITDIHLLDGEHPSLQLQLRVNSTWWHSLCNPMTKILVDLQNICSDEIEGLVFTSFLSSNSYAPLLREEIPALEYRHDSRSFNKNWKTGTDISPLLICPQTHHSKHFVELFFNPCAYYRRDNKTFFRESWKAGDVSQRPDPSISNCSKDALRGDPEAQYSMGVLYANGDGVEQDPAKAIEWFTQAAEGGDSAAMYNLGVMNWDGEGIAQNHEDGVRWFIEAANLGQVNAMINLGVAYRQGVGIPQDYAEAVKWDRKAAELGEVEAFKNLAAAYSLGDGVPQDEEESFRWVERAASKGDTVSMHNLGAHYYEGSGIQQDYAQSVHWYMAAARNRNAASMHNLALMYGNGIGVEKDYATAYKWFTLSESHGHEVEDKCWREKMEARLTAEQIAEAESAAEEWRSAE